MISMPCFSCDYAHSCKYYDNNLWVDWILNNKMCPVPYYTVESIYAAYKLQKMEKAKDGLFNFKDNLYGL